MNGDDLDTPPVGEKIQSTQKMNPGLFQTFWGPSIIVFSLFLYLSLLLGLFSQIVQSSVNVPLASLIIPDRWSHASRSASAQI